MRLYYSTLTGGIKVQTKILDKFALRISQHGNLIANLQLLTPGIHDKGVVDRHAPDEIDALVLEFVVVFQVARNMSLPKQMIHPG